MIKSFFKLLFQDTCCLCNQVLSNKEHVLCIACEHSLPLIKTNASLTRRMDFTETSFCYTGLLHFSKKGICQRLIHQLKYKGNKDIGVYLGQKLGKMIQRESMDIDLVIPVPLHTKKLHKRGYNQSEMIANGIKNYVQAPIDTSSLVRADNSSTQTQKNKWERWSSLQNSFQLKSIQNIRDRHLLLVDDVLTTGATLAACIETLQEAKPKSIHVATLALASE